MEKEMVVKIADNILSPLGCTTAENYAAVKAGRTALRLHSGVKGIPDPFFASLIEDPSLNDDAQYTRFEKMCIRSVDEALSQTCLDTSADDVMLILSTTKGNIHLLAEEQSDEVRARLPIGASATKIAAHFGIRNTAPAVSNACISGLNAQIYAMRTLMSGRYNHVIVVGADMQSPFIVNGFQSLKALSPEICRPFDRDRQGINLGEAAATVIYSRCPECDEEQWRIVDGAIRNDANHISGPSRTGEGSYLALSQIVRHTDIKDIAFINAHGTATLYNDEMESIAISRAGLAQIPVNSMKGYFGHTMGAAGILETVLSMQAIDDHTMLATRNFNTLGVSHPLVVTSANSSTGKKSFIKLMSGFGGCNAAALFTKGGGR